MAKLFHYHWWTDKVEEMEMFYEGLGFRTVLRIGRYQGEMQSFNPPLSWNDFRDKDIHFRIVEMRRGKANLTFGQGKRDQFDHIGFLVDENEHEGILERARILNWKVNVGERRTFIGTPWRLRIELQKRQDVVTDDDIFSIKSMEILLPFKHHPNSIAKLLGLKTIENTPGKVILSDGNWDLNFRDSPNFNLTHVQFETADNDEWKYCDSVNTILYSTKEKSR